MIDFPHPKGEKDPKFVKTLITILCQHDNSFEFRSGVHFGLFGNTIASQGTKQQQDYWEPRVRAGQVCLAPFLDFLSFSCIQL